MPEEYLACVDSEMKGGKSKKTAQKMCAISYFKRHGMSVNDAHKKGIAMNLGMEQNDLNVVEMMINKLSDIKIPGVNATMVFVEAEATTKLQGTINTDFLKEFGIVEIIATKVGSVAYTRDGRALTWTKKSIESTASTWKLKPASANHEKKNFGLIIDAFAENDEVRMVIKVNDYMKEWLLRASDLIGVSIEAVDVNANDEFEIVSATGSGVTFVFPPHQPACPIEEGCKVLADTGKGAEPNVNSQTITTENSQETKIEADKNPLPPNNIIDSEQVIVASEEIQEKSIETGEQMADETKKIETIEASVHTSAIAEKDSVIAQKTKELETLTKEVETLKATVEVFENEKRQKLLATLKDYGVDITAHEKTCPKTLDKMISAIEAFKMKEAALPEINSGAVVASVEQKKDESGTVVSKIIEAVASPVEELSKEEFDRLWDMRNDIYGKTQTKVN